MHMTSMRPSTPADTARANEIVTQLRSGIEKYKDYHVALEEGYKIFLPNVPQPEYHFTKYVNGFLEAFSFDPSRPTSLLYKKTSDGYELVGAMYTMPKRDRRSAQCSRPPERGDVAPAHESLHAAEGPAGHRRHDQVWPQGHHRQRRCLRRRGRPFSSSDLRLDGARLPLRGFAG
jgi:hypothetical protein